MFHPDAWWLLKIPARQVSASLRLQWAVFLGIFLLLLGVPSLADLAIGGRAHLDLIEPSDLVFVAAQGFALLLFVWYFTRIEPADGWLGTRRIVPNLVCFALGLAAIPALHFFAFEAAHRALGDSPLRAPVVHGGPVGAAFTA
ncbi:MAG: hypothetical protein JO317_06330, partial [Verrucomicrobiae bacterium]|nr:hypothetical protein [Verrucomicrobiae bacterium]